MNTDDIEDIYPLSPLQQGMLFHALYEPQSRMYFEQAVVAFEAQVNLEAFGTAWRRVTEANTVLRTSFHWEEGDKAVQVVHRRAAIPVEVSDLTVLPVNASATGSFSVAVHRASPAVVNISTQRTVTVDDEGRYTIVGIVPVDTVKQVHKNKIRSTLPREHLVLAQTPQVFRLNLLKEAFAAARSDTFTGTDESSLVERLEKVEVTVVQGSDRNIKITKPTDMELARLFLSQETVAK